MPVVPPAALSRPRLAQRRSLRPREETHPCPSRVASLFVPWRSWRSSWSSRSHSCTTRRNPACRPRPSKPRAVLVPCPPARTRRATALVGQTGLMRTQGPQPTRRRSLPGAMDPGAPPTPAPAPTQRATAAVGLTARIRTAAQSPSTRPTTVVRMELANARPSRASDAALGGMCGLGALKEPQPTVLLAGTGCPLCRWCHRRR